MKDDSSSFTRIATFRLEQNISLVIIQGSVINFGCTFEDDEDNIDFIIHEKRKHCAIVNAANESCLGGGGVDGAISKAGGLTLFADRKNLPLLLNKKDANNDNNNNNNTTTNENDSNNTNTSNTTTASGGRFMFHRIMSNANNTNNDQKQRRCMTGDARITGPGNYGSLYVPYVIHAVGPNYNKYSKKHYHQADQLLQLAYRSSLNLCIHNGNNNNKQQSQYEEQPTLSSSSSSSMSVSSVELNNDNNSNNNDKTSSSSLLLSPPKDDDNNNNNNDIQQIAFSLLSAGVYRGRRSLRTVLELGVIAIRDWVKENTLKDSSSSLSLKTIYLCAYLPKEVDVLVDVCVQELL